jgi:hypothetical protein
MSNVQQHFQFPVFAGMRWVATAISMITSICYGQTGPGGVGSRSGNSSLVLWLDASQIPGIAHGNNVALWPDQSGFGNNATQTNSNKPNFLENSINGKASIAFDGSNSAMEGQLNTSLSAPLTLFTVVQFHSANQGTNDNDYIFSLGSGTGLSQHLSIARRRADPPTDANKYYSWDGVNTRFGPALPGNTWSLIQHQQQNAAPLHLLWIDGIAQTVADYTATFQSDGAYEIGKWIQLYQHHLDGEIAEILLYDRKLNDAEINILQSYFNAKYTIAIANDKYTGDNPANGDNDLDVAGIGREANGSQSSASVGGLSIALEEHFQNGDYLLAGHAQLFNSTNTVDIASFSGTLKARWERNWWFDHTNTGDPLTVSLAFDMEAAGLNGCFTGSATQYKLLYRASSSGNWTFIDSGSYYQCGQLHFKNITLSQDGYYTIGTTDLNNSPIGSTYTDFEGNGPGGIGSTNGNDALCMWLNANDISGNTGDLIVSWKDRTQNGNDATQSNFVEFPNLQNQTVNGNAAVRFDGINDYFRGNFSNALKAPCTVLIPARFTKTNQGNNDNAYLMSIGQDGALNEHIGISRRRNNVANDVNKYYSYDGSVTRFGPVLSGQQWHILTQLMDTTSNYHQFQLNGSPQTTSDYTAAFNTTATDFRLGRYVGNNIGNYLSGDVGEVIVFSKKLNSAELNILHSSLSAKYNIAVANDKYTGDDPIRNDNDYEVVGIGQEADGANNQCTSSGLALQIQANFQAGDYVVSGRIDESNSISITDIAHSSVTLQARWKRSWWVDISNAGPTATVSLSFDFSQGELNGNPAGDPSNYLLLFRTGTSGNWSTVATAHSWSGDQVHFENLPLSTDGYYTLATIDLQKSPIGPDLDFGNNKWKVYAFNGTTFDNYKGHYEDDTLNFDSRISWPANTSPSNATSYQGDYTFPDEHSVIYKRRSFPCGTYQIDIDAHKDSAVLFIDGNLVWQHGGCCDSHTNVWNGTLNGKSEVELRWMAYTGDSYLSVDFNPPVVLNKWLGNTNDWFNSVNWSLGVLPTANTDVFIPNLLMGPVIDAAGAVCNNIELKGEVPFTLTNNGELSVNGNWYSQSRKVLLDGKLSMNGSCGATSFTNTYQQEAATIHLSNPQEINILENRLIIGNSVTLNSGTLNSNDLLTIASNASGTANVSTITGNAIVGKVVVERYIDAGATNWRFLSSPVANNTLADWSEDFVTSGFPGSHYPSFPFTSIYGYNESTFGTKENGYSPPTSNTQALETGTGYWVWCGDQLTGTGPFTVDVNGTLHQGNVNLPMSYTASAGSSEDGWNLVGNPYASVIDWNSSFWTKSAVNNALYIWNPDAQQYAAYVGGIGVNGGSNFIASSQAFWVQANGPIPTLELTEQVKASSSAPFLKQKPTALYRLSLSVSGNGSFEDETILYPGGHGWGFDSLTDARKLFSSHPAALSIFTLNDSDQIAINAIPLLTTDHILDLTVMAKNSGNYQLKVGHTTPSTWTCLQLKDRFTGITYPIDNDTVLQIYLYDTTTTARFELRFGGKILDTLLNAGCFNSSDGSIVLKGQGVGPWNYYLGQGTRHWTDSAITVYDSIVFDGLTPGKYVVFVENSGFCNSVTQDLELFADLPLKAKYSYRIDSISTNNSVSVHFSNRSENAVNSFWDFGNGLTSTLQHPISNYSINNTYLVRLVASQKDCRDTLEQMLKIDQLSGIRTAIATHFNAYVVNKTLHVNGFVEDATAGRFEVRNALGQQLFERDLPPGPFELSINLTKHPAGVIGLGLYHRERQQSIKLVLQE